MTEAQVNRVAITLVGDSHQRDVETACDDAAGGGDGQQTQGGEEFEAKTVGEAEVAESAEPEFGDITEADREDWGQALARMKAEEDDTDFRDWDVEVAPGVFDGEPLSRVEFYIAMVDPHRENTAEEYCDFCGSDDRVHGYLLPRGNIGSLCCDECYRRLLAEHEIQGWHRIAELRAYADSVSARATAEIARIREESASALSPKPDVDNATFLSQDDAEFFKELQAMEYGESLEKRVELGRWSGMVALWGYSKDHDEEGLALLAETGEEIDFYSEPDLDRLLCRVGSMGCYYLVYSQTAWKEVPALCGNFAQVYEKWGCE
jgi:hypothetical protein